MTGNKQADGRLATSGFIYSLDRDTRLGIVNFGVSPELVLIAKDQFGVDTFVETGTFRGDTANWAADHFKKVYTVEFVAERFRAAQERFRARPNVECLQGNSPDCLRQIVANLKGSRALFWLDAHWNGDGESRENECPVAEEVRIINEADMEAYVLVDDARYFVAPPPAPHDPAQWPALAQLIPALAHTGRYVAMIDDIIAAWPHRAERALIEYARGRPRAWQAPSAAPVAQKGPIFFVSKR